jgi:hypothetical protein
MQRFLSQICFVSGIVSLCFIHDVWAETSQSLVYDITFHGNPVGTRVVTINYLPATDISPYGSRLLDITTDLQLQVVGKDITYHQHATANFSEYRNRFTSQVNVNGDIFELQGKQQNNLDWVVFETAKGAKPQRHIYPAYKMDVVSLSMFDPGQVQKWMSGPMSIYHAEMGDIWDGVWKDGNNTTITSSEQILEGRLLTFSAPDGKFIGSWSDGGLLLNWSVVILGQELEATLRNIPDLPEFGQIQIEESFQGTQEIDL